MKLFNAIVIPILYLLVCNPTNANTESPYSVQDLIKLSSINNTDVQAKQFDIEAASSAVTIAKSQFLPTPSIDSNINKGNDWNTVATISQPLWTGGKLTSGLNVANAQYNLAGISLADTQFTLAQQIISAWASYSSACRIYEEQSKGLLYLKTLKAMMLKRTTAGVSGASDLNLVNARMLQAQSEILQTDAAKKNALAVLSRLVGNPLKPEQIDITPKTLPLAQMSESDLYARVNKFNPSLKKAEAQLKVSSEQIGQAKSSVWPTLSLNVDYQKNNSDNRQYDDDTRVYLRIQQSFGAGFSNFSAVNGAIATRNSAEKSKDYIKSQVEQNSITNWNNYLAARTNTQNISGYQTAIGETLVSYQRLFLAGKKSWLEVLNTAREETSARVQLAMAQTQEYASGWLVLLDRGEVKW